MTSLPSYAADRRTTQHRQCLADFMDIHPQAFRAPSQGGNWANYMDQLGMPEPAERRVLDKALGMVMSVMRSALQNMPGGSSLPALFDRASEMGALEFEPDAGAQAMALQGDTDPSEAAAYGKAILIYRQCIARGTLDGSELFRMLMSYFDQLPAVTPLMRSAIDTAKRMIEIDIDLMLYPEDNHAQV